MGIPYTAICLFMFPTCSFNSSLYNFNFVQGGVIWKYLRYENFAHAEIQNLHACQTRLYETGGFRTTSGTVLLATVSFRQKVENGDVAKCSRGRKRKTKQNMEKALSTVWTYWLFRLNPLLACCIWSSPQTVSNVQLSSLFHSAPAIPDTRYTQLSHVNPPPIIANSVRSRSKPHHEVDWLKSVRNRFDWNRFMCKRNEFGSIQIESGLKPGYFASVEGSKLSIIVQSNLDYPNFDFTNTSINQTSCPGTMHKFIYSWWWILII